MSRRAIANSFAELVERRFVDGVNALCWPRTLDGDFAEIVRVLAPADGVVAVDIDTLASLDLSEAGRIAADAIIHDMQKLDELGRDPVLNCITRYERDERGLAIATDVHSFHVDRAPIEYDTWLCTYWGASSEGLDNDEARRLLDDPALRSALQSHYGLDDERFRDLVHDESFDLHYAPIDGARPYSFGVGNLWRVACDWPGSPVPPCIHRAPASDEPRLLLIC